MHLTLVGLWECQGWSKSPGTGASFATIHPCTHPVCNFHINWPQHSVSLHRVPTPKLCRDQSAKKLPLCIYPGQKISDSLSGLLWSQFAWRKPCLEMEHLEMTMSCHVKLGSHVPNLGFWRRCRKGWKRCWLLCGFTICGENTVSACWLRWLLRLYHGAHMYDAGLLWSRGTP